MIRRLVLNPLSHTNQAVSFFEKLLIMKWEMEPQVVGLGLWLYKPATSLRLVAVSELVANSKLVKEEREYAKA